MTGSPAACRALALASTARVADSVIAAIRDEMRCTASMLALARFLRLIDSIDAHVPFGRGLSRTLACGVTSADETRVPAPGRPRRRARDVVGLTFRAVSACGHDHYGRWDHDAAEVPAPGHSGSSDPADLA